MLVEGQLISRLSGSSVIFLSNNTVAVVKEVSSNTSSDSNTGTDQSSAQEAIKVEGDNTNIGTDNSQITNTASAETTAVGDTSTGTEKSSAEVTQAADTSAETTQQKTEKTGSSTEKSSKTGDTGTESGAEASTTPVAETEKTQTEGAAGGDSATMEGDTGMVQSSGEVAADPAMTEGTQVDPTMQAGMAGGKGTLLSSWPFVGGISIAVILVSIAIGTFLARRKIKKGIEIYED